MATIPIRTVEQTLRSLGFGERVIERVSRLNPGGVPEGVMARGIPPRNKMQSRRWTALVPKGDVLKRYGRAAWEASPNGIKVKDGKRRLMTREAFEDAMPLVYAGLVKRPKALIVYESNRYADDPELSCRVEIAA